MESKGLNANQDTAAAAAAAEHPSLPTPTYTRVVARKEINLQADAFSGTSIYLLSLLASKHIFLSTFAI